MVVIIFTAMNFLHVIQNIVRTKNSDSWSTRLYFHF